MKTVKEYMYYVLFMYIMRINDRLDDVKAWFTNVWMMFNINLHRKQQQTTPILYAKLHQDDSYYHDITSLMNYYYRTNKQLSCSSLSWFLTKAQYESNIIELLFIYEDVIYKTMIDIENEQYISLSDDAENDTIDDQNDSKNVVEVIAYGDISIDQLSAVSV
jgi:hypothetical protein